MSDHDEDNQSSGPSFIKIPPIFHSDLTSKPLERCVMCDRDLLHGFEPYMIEKAFRYYAEYNIRNTIAEFIMCLPCLKKMHDSMSKESLAKIKSYFNQIDMESRKQELLEKSKTDIDPWLAKCIVKGYPIEVQEEYIITGQCIGDQLILDAHPYMICHEASNEISALLSAQTLEEYNRFIDDFFGLPPEFKKVLMDNPSVLV